MSNSDTELKEVVLRDIESVLREKLDNQIIVENYTTKPLLPPGENYGSSIFSVHVELTNKKTGKNEELHLIAKMVPPTEFQKRLFNSSRTFIKEIFMYDNIVPTYNKLELECGFRESELFDILPKFYGSRLSSRPDADFDDDAVILMENLKIKGYYTGERTKGYDLEHATATVKTLARFHALGIATKQKKPGMFEVFKMYAKCLPGEDIGGSAFKSILIKIKNDPEMSPYFERCFKILSEVTADNIWTDSYQEPWTSIIHSDFWVNNVMFHRNNKGVLDSVKFVDFQMYLYASPLRDLIFFLYSSVDLEVTDEQIDDLMDLYYDSFVNTLSKMGCNTDAFTKEEFKKKIDNDAEREFIHACFMVKLLTLSTKDIDDFNYDKMQNAIVEYDGSELFVERLRRVVLSFAKRNWI
ncbi:uncharacterized protein LOC100880729 [Megachile rotundata]|uniref:uncharacterized protein LOC100880729 n=1 Tax=Megachile rotundata TaxID=143995 RepID=UPI003FCF6AB7